jgi:hypothetical protein
MKKSKITKQLNRKLDKLEKEARKHEHDFQTRQEHEFQIRHETRLDTLQGLRQLAEANILIDVAALDRMIDETQKATFPVSEVTS